MVSKYLTFFITFFITLLDADTKVILDNKSVEIVDVEKLPDATIIDNDTQFLDQSSDNYILSLPDATVVDIDFWSLLDHTLLNAAMLILKKHDIKIKQKDIEILKSTYYPNLSIGYKGEYYHGFDTETSTSIGGSFYPNYSQISNTLAITLNQELYRFGATDLKMKITQKEIDIVKNQLHIKEEEISKQLLSYYVSVLKAQENIKYKNKIKSIQQKIVMKKQRLFEAGQISKVELAKDEVVLITLEKEISKEKLDFSYYINKINVLANINIDSSNTNFKMLEPKNIQVKTFKESAIAKDLQLQIEKKLNEIDLIQKDYLPAIYANGGYRFYGTDEDSFYRTIENLKRNSWDVGISFKWNLFNGYKTDNKVKKAKLEMKKLVEQYRLAKIDFETKEKQRTALIASIENIES